jgi:hypothetical protein
MTGLEPVTCCLRNSCSTTELHRPDALKVGLGLEMIPGCLVMEVMEVIRDSCVVGSDVVSCTNRR